MIKQKYVKIKYQQKLPLVRSTGVKIQNFITTLMRTDKVLNDGERQLYTPTIEETVGEGLKNVATSLEHCLKFVSQRLKDSQLTDKAIQLMLKSLFSI